MRDIKNLKIGNWLFFPHSNSNSILRRIYPIVDITMDTVVIEHDNDWYPYSISYLHDSSKLKCITSEEAFFLSLKNFVGFDPQFKSCNNPKHTYCLQW
jgi:hypothetical protein